MAIVQSIKDGHYLSFDEDKHKYILDGERVPGATTFCHGGYPTSEALISWMKGQTGTAVLEAMLIEPQPITEIRKKEIVKEAKKKDREKSEEAASIGTLLHDYAYHMELTGVVPPEMLVKINSHKDSDKAISAITKFNEWRETNVDKMVASEAIVASFVHQFGGKFDRLADRNGILVLSDFKSSNAIYVDQFIQLGAYSVAIREWLGLDVKGLEILRFGKEDGEFQTLLIDNPEEIKMFEAQAMRCRDTYEFRKIENDKRFKWGGEKKK